MTHIYDVISESQLQTGISSTGTRQLGQTLAVATLGSCVLTLFRFPVPSRSSVVPTRLRASSILNYPVILDCSPLKIKKNLVLIWEWHWIPQMNQCQKPGPFVKSQTNYGFLMTYVSKVLASSISSMSEFGGPEEPSGWVPVKNIWTWPWWVWSRAL